MKVYTAKMVNEEELRAEIYRLKQQSIHDQAKARKEFEIAEWKSEAQKSKSNETLAIVLVLLICAVIIAVLLI